MKNRTLRCKKTLGIETSDNIGFPWMLNCEKPEGHKGKHRGKATLEWEISDDE